MFAVLPAAARRLLEEFMTTTPFRYRSEFALRYYNQGQARGEAKGEARGEAKALLTILDTRGVPVPDHIRADIMACTDTTRLETWIRRAVTADKIQDVLA